MWKPAFTHPEYKKRSSTSAFLLDKCSYVLLLNDLQYGFLKERSTKDLSEKLFRSVLFFGENRVVALAV